MSVSRIAGRYAKSLLDLSSEQGNVDRVLNDMKSLKSASEVRDFALMMKSPILKSDTKSAAFNRIFSGKLDPMTDAFVQIILRKGRERFIPEIASEFIAQYRAQKGISYIRLITATPWNNANVEKLRQKLISSGEVTDKVEIKSEVDDSLIGGFIVEFNNKRYDASIAEKLFELNKNFVGNDYVRQY